MASNSEQHHSNRKFEVNSDAGASEISSAAVQPVSMASKAIAGTSANAANSASYHHGRQTSLPASMNIQQQPPPQQPPIPQPLYGNQPNHVHFQNDLILRHQRVPHQQLSDHHQNINQSLDMDLYGGNRLPPPIPRSSQHELKRPDSVITTSSIVSSDTASQAGDSSTEASGPPSAYAISGLYGERVQPGRPLADKKAVSRRRTHSGSLGLASNLDQNAPVTSNPSAPSTSGVKSGSESTSGHPGGHPAGSGGVLSNGSALVQADHVLLSKSNSCATTTNATNPGGLNTSSVLLSKTHRRQTSHPVGNGSNVNSGTTGNGTDNTNSLAAEMIVSSMLANSSRMKAAGHRRSHSYGHHKGFHEDSNNQHRHRRTGSSVIETLQTLACTGAENDNPNDNIAQFLENLRKEQAEKNEKREMQEMQEELEDLRDCGLGNCRPAFLQSSANIKFFVFLLSMLMTIQQALTSGYLNSVITTIEKRYEIPSSISGIIASMYEIGNVVTVIFVSYLGSRRHIPIWIGMGVLVMGIGSVTFSLPHFLTGPYRVRGSEGLNSTLDNICKAPSLSDQVDRDTILQIIPGLQKIKSLVNSEGLSNPPLAPHNQNQYNREANCIEQADESAALPIFVFMVAQLLLGCGGSPLFTLGTTYIDNHVKRDSSSMYIGFMYSMCAFGPVCGFLLGAYLLSHHVDTFTWDVSTMLNIDSSDRHWVGMWWGGFLICGLALIFISFPFFFFPKELKKEKAKVYIDDKYHHAAEPSIRPKSNGDGLGGGQKTASATSAAGGPSNDEGTTAAVASKASTLVRKDNANQGMSAHQPKSGSDAEQQSYGKDIKDIPRSTWKLLTNKIYLVTCLGACMELIIVSGFIVFLPKYLETQFNLSKSMASMFTGGIAIPGACIGIFFGGYILKRLQLRPKGAVQLVIFFNILCLSCYALLFFFGCDNIKMAGTTMPYYNTNNNNATEQFQINLTASCNFGCACDMNDVQPVCGANGLTYFSPCHAGCTSSPGAKSDNYTNCACVLNNMQQPSPLVSSGVSGYSTASHSYAEVTMIPVATAGPCYKECDMILPFMVLLFFMTLLVAVTQMPVLMVVLRSVAEEEKAFALGIQFVIFRLFGYIPSPILFGHVIDSTCLLWKSTCDGEAGGRCLMYDIEAFRFKYVGVCCGIKVLSCIVFVLDWYLIQKKETKDKKQTALTVGEVVNSIISVDKLFEPDGPTWVKMVDPEGEVREEDEFTDQNPEINNIIFPDTTENSAGAGVSNPELMDENEQKIVVSHPRRKNHNSNIKKTPPMTPSKSTAEHSSCLVERRL